MDEETLNKIEKAIAASIEKTVNGKINLLTKEFREYVTQDEAWKDKAAPVLKMGESVQGFGKVSLYLLGFISALGGAILLLLNLFRIK